MFQGPQINKLGGNLGAPGNNTDKTFGLIAGGVTVADKIAIGDIVELLQPSDADAYGLTSAYDSANKVLVRHHIEESFTYCPDGHLFVMLVPQGTTMKDICDPLGINAPVGPGALLAMMTAEVTRREIKCVGVVLNPGAEYVPVLATGLDKDVVDAIPKAQATIDSLKTQFIYLDRVFIEGRQVNGTIALMLDLRTLTCPDVSVVIAADPAIQALDPAYAKYAAVGTALGNLAIRKVSECLGSVAIVNPPDAKKGFESFSICNTGYGKWASAALSSGQKFATLSLNDQNVLTTKGYIYVGSFNDYAGLYFNDSPSCIAISDDYAYIERSRVWNKAARYLRTALIPKIRSKYKKDATTGFATASVIANWTQAAKKKLELMVSDDEVSAVGVYINPKQAPSASSPLLVQVALVIDGILREITINLSLANSL
jgi:hypothetical protein